MQTPPNKQAAQKRVDRIHLFREELAILKRENILALSPEQSTKLERHHDRLLKQLSEQFDTDTTDSERKLTAGMRILAFLGAFALSASVFFLFYQVWGDLTTPVKVAILIGAPLLATYGVEFFARREKTLYYAALCALLAFACFVLNLHVFGQMFNITPTPKALLIWGVFGLILAYLYGFRSLLIFGLLSLLGYTSAFMHSIGQFYWYKIFERLENLFIPGFLMLLTPVLIKHQKNPQFPAVYRVIGLLTIFISILFLSFFGKSSYLPWTSGQVEVFYQFIGFSGSGLTLWLGIRLNDRASTGVASSFLVLFFYIKMFDWFWEEIPRSLFFFGLSVITIGLLAILKKIRSRGQYANA